MQVEKAAVHILQSAIDGTVVEPARRSAEVVVRTRDGTTIPLAVKWAGEGWPQDVRQAVGTVDGEWPAKAVVVARHLSPGSIEWLRERGANWADEVGNVRILGPKGLIVIREPSAPAAPRASAFSWSPSALHVAEFILAQPGEPLRTEPLAKKTDWSVPQVAKVLKSFDEQGWTVKRGGARGPTAHREVRDRTSLLESWSAGLADAPRPTRLAHRAERDWMTFLIDQLAPALGDGWAVSGWAGLELSAPFATTTPSLHVYVNEFDFAGELSDVMAATGLREVDAGERVTFWSIDPWVLHLADPVRDVPVVSAPRLYADLSALGARGQDAADHVRGELIDSAGEAHDTRG